MRRLVLLALLPLPAAADPCADRLAGLLGADMTADGPYVAMNTTEMMGQRMVYRQSQISDLHYMVETLEPVPRPAMVHQDGTAWQSDDAGGWTVAWEAPAEDLLAQMAALRTSLASGVLTAECGTEDRDGTAFELVSGTVGPTDVFGEELAVSYLVDPATGRPVRITQDYVSSGMEVSTLYEIEFADDLELPTPSAD
ncbi:hypothetical protein [Wenxinia marina]|uniref:Outer membrane lipoprotein-sorting protein n=1 Tax=Wenxinia marina DSM 24838 TaxID=1123501 RepID=A0A0D0Q8P4_9RHOB|nr:hypothetical protein [Wenxinia marina]KIQ67488.1 hypothetical protein Wenmar_03912 [Wenxinia marina DSM 24838]GGL69135.1 hypothetical protein GCM10011392_24470 [Wenxinia marina]